MGIVENARKDRGSRRKPTGTVGETVERPGYLASTQGISAIRLALVPMAIAWVACLLLLPSAAALAAGLLLARLRLERIRVECERDVAIARIKADSEVTIARLSVSGPVRRRHRRSRIRTR
jgi:hypothetical protein